MPPLPQFIDSVEALEELLSRPTPALVTMMGRLEGDLIFLGAGGKMGPTMARMARRATEEAGVQRRIIAASRFSTQQLESELQAWGVETIRCDMLDPGQVAMLPKLPNVVYMTGMKFGSTGQEALTWAMNTWLPSLVCEQFSESRIVAFSPGNVYGLTPLSLGGSVETDPLNPVGEYAMSALGRERIFEYFSQADSIPTSILRLNYATEMRYGVLVDVARQVYEGQPIDVSMGSLNAIWQGDANAMSLLALEQARTPAWTINIAGPEQISVRRAAETFGRLMKKDVVYEGEEAPDALLSNGQKGHALWGYPSVCLDQMLCWIAEWVAGGGASLNKPTHFENRAGNF
ncbi:MAG: NAD-dependent epimerase/dehydratase family protein [Candidatus Hydrogenedentes bacterium]|nr:NAD-dependent epimerase/dehydratase family protein [Candidatus Hydrogenedentota bacterium]